MDAQQAQQTMGALRTKVWLLYALDVETKRAREAYSDFSDELERFRDHLSETVIETADDLMKLANAEAESVDDCALSLKQLKHMETLKAGALKDLWEIADMLPKAIYEFRGVGATITVNVAKRYVEATDGLLATEAE